MELLTHVRELAIEQVNFTNKQREALVEAENEAYGELHRATLEFETEALNADADPIPGATALVKLAGKIGNRQPDITDEEATETKGLINDIYENPNNEALETAGENLFAKALDFILKAKALNKFEQSSELGD